ncbi:glycosyltransferase [Aeromonas veronii]|uniref:glycosyltransferase n=1 Tax=Aeromonas veronii TaxID=654 RepID=UPI000954F2AB|nr:glycosyltransferase [Aeromonas veronii]SIQ21785.1 hypothetical protein SAMN05892873_10552 [Aeromonas veronii]
MKKNKLWVVLGMHRSGTSAMSRALSVLGAHHGHHVTAVAQDNPTGFWEDAEVVAFNDGLLASLGLGWFDLTPLPQGVLELPLWRKKREQAKALMQERFLSCTTFALKDPRLCRLLPFWQAVWNELELDVRYVFCVRDPAGVAQSLAKRNLFAAGYSSALWLRYILDALQAISKNEVALVVDYNDLLRNSKRQLERMAQHFGSQCDDLELEHFSNYFLDISLDHGVLTGDSPLCELASSLYQDIKSIDVISSVEVGRLEYYSQLLLKFTIAMREDARYADGLHNSLTWQHIQHRHDQDIFDLNSQIPRVDSEINEIRKVTHGEIVRLDANINEANKVVHGEIVRLDASINETSKVARGEIARLDGLVDGLLHSDSVHSAWINQLSSHLTNINDSFANKIADLEEDFAAQRSELNEISSSQLRLIERLKEQNNVLNDRIHQQSDQINHLLSAVYWKRRVIKRVLASGYHRSRPLVRNLRPWIPTQLANTIKSFIDRRVLSSSTYSLIQSTYPVFSEVTHSEEQHLDENIQKALNCAGSQFDVIVFPVIDWAFRVQRPQHLARELGAAGHRVFYLTTTFFPSKKAGFVLLDNPAPNVFVCQLNLSGVHPVIYQTLPKGKVLNQLRMSLDGMRSTLNIKNSVSIIDLPFWHKVADAIPANQIVYDCMDYHPGFSTNSDQMHQQEQQLLQDADLVITTSSRLSDFISEVRENSVIRNAAEVAFFSAKSHVKLYSSSKKVVGYYGAISDWFDMDLVIKSAQAYPEWDFVLVGSTFGCDISVAEKEPNIHFTGEVPYADLPGYLSAFDVCTIPFKLVELTLCTNPVKVYEYLAAGKPVVATAMPEVLMIDDMVHVGHSSSEYIKQLAVAMSEAENEELASCRSNWAMQHDWKSRAELLTAEIVNCQPKVSIIVLTYNNLDLTKACLHSIEKHSHYSNIELILVDNASSDGTPEFLISYAEGKEHVVLCLNDTNLGFSAGNNVGLKAATGEYIVILNNDTYVTEGWIHGLVRGLRRNPSLGLVGPVTNNIGNEAKININYSDMEQMAIAAREYTRTHAGEVYPVRAAAFFCVMFSRIVYEKVGPMEERFGVGFFEDDDYCNRVREAGYDVAVIEDVFVHHHLSASFNKLKAEKKQELFDRNKKIYEDKWGNWIPHKYRDGVK